MIEAVLLLGGNVGEVEHTFVAVCKDLEQEVGDILSSSSVMDSPAWGFSSQAFSNQAVIIATELDAESLLDTVQSIEQRHGRDRDEEQKNKAKSGERYSERVIDIDIIFYGDNIVESDRLTIPHLLMTKRRFVLEPIVEIAPHLVHPKDGRSVEQILKELKD